MASIALVLELVDGSTLADRITKDPIPLEEALPIAKQIAEALEAAHEQGIIHRDLKPANIKLRGDGTVKVLDFGLAKLTDTASPETPSRGGRSQSPTITSPAIMTGVGVILGTAAYMAPEQAKGREADKRSDIWAFGVVLYEMLAGVRAFDGEDVTDVLGAVVRLEPNWDALPSNVLQPVRTLLQSCLVKDRRHRVSDISTALFVLDKSASLMAGVGTVSTVSRPRSPLSRLASLAVAVLVAAAVTAVVMWFALRPVPPPVIRTTVTTSGTAELVQGGVDRDIAITPDGSRVVYRGNNQLLLRSLNQLEPTVLSGLGAPRGLFISPDGQWIGFFDENSNLKRVAVTGGAPVLIRGNNGDGGPRGGTWGPDGTIVFATDNPATGLQRVSVTGGEHTVLTRPNHDSGEGYHLWPQFLPGGRAVLFTITPVGGQTVNAQIAVLDLQTGTSKVLVRGGSDAHYVATGHLLYTAGGTLQAVPFDLRRLEVVGTAAPVLEGLATTLTGVANFAVSTNGTLVYVPGGGGFVGQQAVVSVDRQGRASPLPNLPADAYRDVRVSPDGARLALATQDDVWIYDLSRPARTRLTTNPARDTRPLWTPNGQRIVFSSRRSGIPELFWRLADSTGSEERLLARAEDLIDLRADGWSADGKQLLFTEVSPNYQGSIWQMALDGSADAKMLLKSEFYNDFPAVAPDGLWIAYESNVSGQYEIYVERYPELGSRQQISTGGGRLPLWSRDGGELFFSSLNGRQMFTVAVQTGPTLVAGRTQVLFESVMGALGGGSRRYDVDRDDRFFIIRNAQEESGPSSALNINLVQNWFEELNRLVPTK